MNRIITSVNTQNIPKKTLYADNYYSSYDVCKLLEAHGWDFVMTIRKNRVKAETTKKMGNLEMNTIPGPENTHFKVLEFQAKKDKIVRIVYSKGQAKNCEVKRNHKKPVIRPKVIHDYIMHYSTIDKLDQLTYYCRFPYRCHNWTTCVFVYCLHLCILQAHSLFQLQTKKHISIIDFVFLLIDAIKPNTHTEIRQHEVAVRIDQILFTHAFLPISKFLPDKIRPNRLCNNCRKITLNQCKCGVYFCRDCHTRHLLIIQEQALTGGE
ncbi:Transposase_IS4 [Hexamita inflata]|uniref:Transposase IS4 n=1 Tax=Hexamita inflata TaxID=28002 RepID=A0AA86NA44_9EUKA|nr:Transposase IS4 [Hexamita inflata]